MYNRFGIILLIGICLTIRLCAEERTQELVNCEDLTGWKGMVKINNQVKHSGKGSFELFGNYPTELITAQMIPIEMSKTYTLSAWFRSLDKELPASAYLGLRMYDKNKKQIFICNTDTRLRTETTLVADAVMGTKELKIAKNAAWLNVKHSVVAFNIKENFEDLPNFDISSQIDKVIEEEGQHKVVLRASLKKNYPAGTTVRLHSQWKAPFYWVAKGWLPPEWIKYSNTMKGEAQRGIPMNKFWKGTKYVRVFVWFGNWDRKPKEGAKLLVDDITFLSFSKPKLEMDSQLK